jgi:hypothetical protein
MTKKTTKSSSTGSTPKTPHLKPQSAADIQMEVFHLLALNQLLQEEMSQLPHESSEDTFCVSFLENEYKALYAIL